MSKPHLALPVALLQWTGLGTLVGVACGLASALFLWLLELATETRVAHEELVYALPLAGLGIGWIYERWGQPIAAGNNLVIDTVHQVGDGAAAPTLPLRMAPMVLVGTVLTHLFGGSAGREGTAVQMGASLADAMAARLAVKPELRRLMLAAGIAGGFGSVFGTPIAGMVFGLEVIVIGRLEYHAIVPAMIAAIVGDQVTRACGIVHTAYPTIASVPLTPLMVGQWVLFAAAIAATTYVFVELTHSLKTALTARVSRLPFRMMIGGAVVVLLWQVVGTSDYLGLGVPTILRSFTDPELPSYAFALKLLFTAVTLGAGFLGGEVTPLFFVGAALGSVLARLLGMPIELGAAVGLASVFAAASNAPLALTVMAVELCGGAVLPHVAIVCVLAFIMSGHRGIYPSQLLSRRKWGGGLLASTALRDVSASAAKEPARPESSPMDREGTS
jgi:H+/Cl- antiporter ClcA